MDKKQEAPPLAAALTVPPIDLNAIAMIESSGGKHTKSAISGDSVGTYQVRPIVAKDYALTVGGQVPDLNDPAINQQIANWYFQQRIPQLLTNYGIPVTLNNVLASYNMGPAGFSRHYKTYGEDTTMLPKITAQYLKKYAKLTEGQV